MKKPKIAISLDQGLLELVDSKVDGSVIRSRSQAIEFFLRKGLQGQTIKEAILLIKGEHQENMLKQFKGKSVVKNQLQFFKKFGITNVYIVTQHSSRINELLAELDEPGITAEIVESTAKGNAQAVLSLKNKIKNNFLVMSGDIYNEFDVLKMVKKHLELNTLATMGLMTREDVSNYGTAILDGDFVIEFQEKPKKGATNIVNAGIYLFKPEIFELLDAASLEKDLFPKLARMKQLSGFFSYGEYRHFG